MLSLMTTPVDTTSQAWVPSIDTFGSRLALVRHRMNWNVKEAARECGLPAATWRSWEMDGSLPRNIVTVATTISTRTGCDYLWLVHGPDRGGARSSGPYSAQRVIAARKPRSHDVSAHALPSTRPVRQTRPFRAPSRRQSIDV